MGSGKMRLLLLLLLLTAGCGNGLNDLYPSGEDKRPVVQCGIPGANVCQTAPDFTLADTLGNSVTLSSEVSTTGVQGTVLYFTMWCPVCKEDMTFIDTIIPQYPNVRFYAVDYVSASVALSRDSELTNFPTGSGFTVLVDAQQSVLALYQASMAATVVIDRNGVIRMNEGYRNNVRLMSILNGLP